MEGFGKIICGVLLFILIALAITTWNAHKNEYPTKKAIIQRKQTSPSKK